MFVHCGTDYNSKDLVRGDWIIGTVSYKWFSTNVLTHKWVLNNENTWTQGGEHHTLASVGGEIGEGQRWVGSWGEMACREMPDIGDGEEDSKSHCHVCTYATILHVLHMYPKT